jgi:AbiV family abortive infection protein
MARRVFQDLDDEQTLRRWFWALVANADALRADATWLMRRGSTGRALAMALLALEETTKAAHIAELDEEHRASGAPFAVDGETLERWTRHTGKLPSAMLATVEQRPDLLALFTPTDAFDDLSRLADGQENFELIEPLVHLYMGIRASARNLNALKQRGLYTDVVDGRVASPVDVAPDLAAAVLEAAEVCAEALLDQLATAEARLGRGSLDQRYP